MTHAGNRPTKEEGAAIATYSTDVEDRVTQAQPAGGTTNTMSYYGDGKRRAYVDSDIVRTFLWDAESIARQTLRDYTYNPQRCGELMSQSGCFHHFDALGSTMQMTDGSGNVTNEYRYRAFGGQSVLSGSHTNPFTWVGRFWLLR